MSQLLLSNDRTGNAPGFTQTLIDAMHCVSNPYVISVAKKNRTIADFGRVRYSKGVRGASE